jgi:hypothetical protein
MPITIDGTNGISDVRSTTDGSAATPAIRGTDTNTGIFFPAADTIAFTEGGVEAARFNSNGSLAIGTTSTSATLSLNSASAVTGMRILNSNVLYADFYANSSNVVLNAVTAIPLSFGTNNTERMRIDSSGNLLVGKTATANTTVGSEIRPDGQFFSTNASSTNSITTWNVYSTGAGAYRFYVGFNGTVYATSIAISAISDARLKENIKDIDTGLDSIMALKPRRFDWKDGKGQDKKNVAGFIAQEFETVFPECVSTTLAGKDGIEYKNINHETLIPTLVKAIQEQQTLINNLTTRLNALEGK